MFSKEPEKRRFIMENDDNNIKLSPDDESGQHGSESKHTRSPAPQQVSSTSFFYPMTNWLNQALKLHKLLISSSVISTQKITTYLAIPNSRMITDEMTAIDDTKLFQIGFARKHCSHTPITHASLAFRDIEADRFLVVGRQNNQFLKGENINAEISFSRWMLTYMMNFKTLYHFTETQMDNEMKFHFFPGAPFNAEISEATISGAQIKQLIKKIDESICLTQRYDAIHSNCYSAVAFGLSQAIFMINAKSNEADADLTDINKNLTCLFTLLCQTLQDNYRMGSGTVNNAVVNKAVQDTINILSERQILHIDPKVMASRESEYATPGRRGQGV